jgi:hypothetical protein
MKAINSLQKKTLQIFSANGVVQKTVFTDGHRFYTTEYLKHLSDEQITAKSEQHARALAAFKKPE